MISETDAFTAEGDATVVGGGVDVEESVDGSAALGQVGGGKLLGVVDRQEC